MPSSWSPRSVSRTSRASRAPSFSWIRPAMRWNSSHSAIPTPSSNTEASMNSFEIGHQLTAVTMGIDAFERRQPADTSLLGGEGLVPIYLGGSDIPARDYADVETIKSDLDALAAEAAALTEGPRKV